MDIEVRDWTLPREMGLQLRAAPEGAKSPGILGGYAAVYNRYSSDLGGFVEQIAPTAFARILGSTQSVCLHNHDLNRQLGARRSETLVLTSDAIGLRYDCTLPDTALGNEVAELVSRGDLQGSSFAFRLARRPDGSRAETWGVTEQDFPLRTIEEVAYLRDVGPVVIPAYPSTEDLGLALRGLADGLGRPVADLVSAAAAHELRSLIPQRSEGTPEPPAGPPVDVDTHRRRLALRERAARDAALLHA